MFKPATLYNPNNLQDRVAVKTKEDADAYFARGYKLEQQAPTIKRAEGGGVEVAKPSPLMTFQKRNQFTDTVQEYIRRKQEIMQPIKEQKAFWRARQDMPFEDPDFYQMSPDVQARARQAQEATSSAHIRGIEEEETYRRGQVGNVVDSITDMYKEMDKKEKDEYNKSRQKTDDILQIVNAYKNTDASVSWNEAEQMLEKTLDKKTGIGYRTDRHNNPTAFTTDIAKQAGLIKGVDYTVGDPFGEKGECHTARLLGGLDSAIKTTIKVIDKIGFYTQSGDQRWKHTAMPKESWDSLDSRGKEQIIKAMYKEEGGVNLFEDKDDNIERVIADIKDVRVTKSRKINTYTDTQLRKVMELTGATKAELQAMSDDELVKFTQTSKSNLVDKIVDKIAPIKLWNIGIEPALAKDILNAQYAGASKEEIKGGLQQLQLDPKLVDDFFALLESEVKGQNALQQSIQLLTDMQQPK